MRKHQYLKGHTPGTSCLQSENTARSERSPADTWCTSHTAVDPSENRRTPPAHRASGTPAEVEADEPPRPHPSPSCPHPFCGRRRTSAGGCGPGSAAPPGGSRSSSAARPAGPGRRPAWRCPRGGRTGPSPRPSARTCAAAGPGSPAAGRAAPPVGLPASAAGHGWQPAGLAGPPPASPDPWSAGGAGWGHLQRELHSHLVQNERWDQRRLNEMCRNKREHPVTPSCWRRRWKFPIWTDIKALYIFWTIDSETFFPVELLQISVEDKGQH